MDAQVGRQLVALLPRLRRFARGLAGSVSDADDLVQAACERAIRNVAQWQPGTRLDSWMFRIIQTIWLDSHRRRERERAAGDLLSLHAVREQDGEAEAHLMLERVRAAMGLLPEDQRAVLMLVCVEGHTYREASEVLGIPIGTVMSRLSRARLALHDAVAPQTAE